MTMRNETGTIGGYTREEIAMMSAVVTIDRFRYPDETDRILARHEDLEGDLPSDQDLADAGFYLPGLANALEKGLDAAAFMAAFHNGLESAGFNVAVTDDAVDIASLNDGLAGLNAISDTIAAYQGDDQDSLEMLRDQQVEMQTHPSALDRAMHRLGECGC